MAAQDVPTSGGGNVKPPSDGPTPEETQTATAAAAALASANLALLHKETERVSKKQKISVAKTTETIDGMLEEVRRTRSHLAEISEPGDRRAVVDDLHASLNKANYASQVSSSSVPFKELHACVGKLGKAVDKVFTHACPTQARWDHPLEKNALRQAIAQHLFRRGLFELGDAYCASTTRAASSALRASDASRLGEAAEEAAEEEEEEETEEATAAARVLPGVRTSSSGFDTTLLNALKAPFREMHAVASEIERNRNLEPLARWIDDHRAKLISANGGAPIPLEFRMHKLRFMRLLVGGGGGRGGGGGGGGGGSDGGDIAAAVAYGRAHFAPFALTHMAG